MTDFDYTSLTCPLPADGAPCGHPLHLNWTLGRPLFVGDFAEAEPPNPGEDAYVSAWEVVCESGHTILVPGPTGCPRCGDSEDCQHEDFDASEESRTFRAHDLVRLQETLGALKGVPA